MYRVQNASQIFGSLCADSLKGVPHNNVFLLNEYIKDIFMKYTAKLVSLYIWAHLLKNFAIADMVYQKQTTESTPARKAVECEQTSSSKSTDSKEFHFRYFHSFSGDKNDT